MKKSSHYSPEVRECAVRMLLDHQKDYGSQWEAIVAISGKIDCMYKSDDYPTLRVPGGRFQAAAASG
jgi:hypothetical protein